jgi:hypothetical protein
MKINETLQKELMEYLFLQVEKTKEKNKKEKKEKIKIYNKGVMAGIGYAIKLINKWNIPNKGRIFPIRLK